MWTFCVYTVFIEPKDDTACFSSNNDATITVVMGHLTFVFGIDVGGVTTNATHGQCSPLQSLLAGLETIKLVLVQI